MDDIFEKTLAIIGSQLFPKLPSIHRGLCNEGLFILYQKTFRLRKTQSEYLATNVLKSPSPDFVEWSSSGPVQVMILGGSNAVSRGLGLIGQSDIQASQVRVSPSLEDAAREIRFFFPATRFETDLGLSARGYLAETVYPKVIEGLVEMCRVEPPVPVLWLAEWLLENRPLEQ